MKGMGLRFFMKVKVFEGTGDEIESVINDWLGRSEFEVFHIGTVGMGDKIVVSVFYQLAN